MRKYIIVFTVLLFTISCNEEKILGPPYIEDKYIDQMYFEIESDTINILLEYHEYFIDQSKKIPFSYLEDKTEGDSIILTFYTSYGAYINYPNIKIDTSSIQDTLYIWYSTIDNPNYKLSKSNFVVDVETSPQYEYVIIDSVTIKKSKSKVVNFNYRRISVL